MWRTGLISHGIYANGTRRISYIWHENKVLSVDDVVFLHDRAPCMSSQDTQDLLRDNAIDFFDNSQWPGNSPDLNPTENLGAIVKQRVEERFIDFGRPPSLQEMKTAFSSVVSELSRDTALLQGLLRSMRRRLDMVLIKKGSYTSY